jgi:hypothetical protein
MSNPARRRGRGGNPQSPSDSSSARGGGMTPGAFDGPASRGGGSSNTGSAGPAASTAPSAHSGGASQPGSQPTSPPLTQTGSFAPASTPASPAEAPTPLMTDPARDPARQARLTDSLRNVDLPASFYNLDNLVCYFVELLALSSHTLCLGFPGLHREFLEFFWVFNFESLSNVVDCLPSDSSVPSLHSILLPSRLRSLGISETCPTLHHPPFSLIFYHRQNLSHHVVPF